ncbi:MAG: penicillin-binding protein 1A [Armatimonadota bacterium]|nr:penicillin-binding protein 1A [Armatimonadota bacterium]MDR7533368.1 penicillin-binding protein 1A [Armatimonadota bacterium]MDR7536488.1 penicillin-binding protein 1A [Armatimonadota bacterium]
MAALAALALVGAAALIGGGVAVGVAVAVGRQVHDVSRLYAPPSQTTRIYAENGELIASLYRENRRIVPLTAVPLVLRQAVIAIEDERFYTHRGIDPRGIARALWRNLREGAVVEGGSTITQQLARNLFLSQERALSRKVAEMLLAIEIERRLTKDEILERYLNLVYFGQGAYGVEMAAQVYFGKPARDVTLGEAALLAGLIRAPSVYSPYRNPGLARARQELVLQRMVQLGYITPAQAAAAQAARIALAPASNAGLVGIRAPYFVSFILTRLLETYGEELVYKGGLQVYTTLDPRLQALADQAVRRGLEAAVRRRLNATQAALVALDPRTGAIRAMIGGADFARSQFNRAWQARRQPGSAFKVFVYTTAISRGIPPTRILEDLPTTYRLPGAPPWTPKNYDGKFSGPVTLRRALEQSINVPAARMIAELGPKDVVATARKMGIESPLQPVLSLALGSADVTPLEMSVAFAALANGGLRVHPLAILKVTDARGKVLEEYRPRRELALEPDVAYVMTDLLKGVIERGTGRAAALGRPAAGKTGTTDDYRNAWFVGYTPYLAAAVWVGNDDNTPMRRVVGGGLPAEIWAAFMKPATQAHPPDDWTPPEGVVITTVCAGSWDLATPACPHPRREVFTRASAPSYSEPQPDQQSVEPVPLTLAQPRDGEPVAPPFVVAGVSAPGAMVTIEVSAWTAAGLQKLVEVSMQTDAAGRFAYEFTPAARTPGGRYVITVSALALSGGRASRTLTVGPR